MMLKFMLKILLFAVLLTAYQAVEMLIGADMIPHWIYLLLTGILTAILVSFIPHI